MRFIYGENPLGKLLLNGLFKRKLMSFLFGKLIDSKLSRARVQSFIQDYNMDMSDYLVPDSGFSTFNEFFYRQIKPEARPIGEGIVSPADGKLLVFNKLEDSQAFFIKGDLFDVRSFLNNEDLAKTYQHGAMAIIRLAPTDYHRYHFPASGFVGKNHQIKGDYYSVSPIALDKKLRIFCQNKRCYSVLKTAKFGKIVICDVGATMTGSMIQTHNENSNVKKGEEKGYFAFGGSTIVLLFEPNQISFDTDLIEHTKAGIETAILMGESIGNKLTTEQN
ncbi:MAG: archaetidylserine decarboxylase, partial [Flavobacteriales bacterium]